MRQTQSRKKKGADVEPAEKAICHDTGGKGYRQHGFVQWGDDPRFQRCSRCGTINAEGISSEAKYPREKQPERPRKHYHTFVPCGLDRRYERCYCGVSRRIEERKPTASVTKADLDVPTVVVHCRKDACDIYIGRPMPRFPELRPVGFGNPFTTRNLPKGYTTPVDAFRDWLLGKPALAELYREQRAVMLTQLPMLRGKVLGCWCAPKGGIIGSLYGADCHGEVLAWLADHPEYVEAHQAPVGGAA